MLRNILTVAVFVWMVCCWLPALAQDQGPQGVGASEFDTSKEHIGELRLGLPEKDVSGNIPCKPKKGKEIYEGATGDYVQTWKFPECGIVLKMGSERKGGAKVVQSISITAPSTLMTGKGIHIGSKETEVVDAYGQYRDPEETSQDKQFVAGSIYGGMIFDLKGGKVVGIFLGAAAE